MSRVSAILCLFGWIGAAIMTQANSESLPDLDPSPRFTNLGIPVTKGGLMGTLVGPGPEEGSERIYFNFRQDGGKLFLVSVDPETGESEQFPSPAGTGAWGFMVGPHQRIYLGTHEGPDPEDSGRILVFDPKNPEDGIRLVGRPSATETYIWMFTIGPDHRIYGCTYPSAKLVSYDPETGELADLGVMDETQKYTRSICTGPDGNIYLGIGYGKANIVCYDPRTGEHRSILPDAYREAPEQTVATVYTGMDGNVYATVQKMVSGSPAGVTLAVSRDEVVEATAPSSAARADTLRDGRRVRNATLDGTYQLAHPDGSVEERTFEYRSDGAGIFMVSNGPLDRIYGGTFIPNELFWFDPASGRMENPGNPTEVGGEIYSMLEWDSLLYICAYPGSFLSTWDPERPWNYGRGEENNPRGFGRLGRGHLRPTAMTAGPGNVIYIGSHPEYGRHGGALGVWDTSTDTLAANHVNLIANQAISSLVYDPESGILFGGSCTAGGGGTDPIEPASKFFEFDTKTESLVMESVPFEGSQNIVALCLVGRRIFGVASPDLLFVYDMTEESYAHRAELGFGRVLANSFKQWRDGFLYGLTPTKIFRIDPDSFDTRVVATYHGTIGRGFAMDEHGIYFGERATLMRYEWPGTEME
jgi:hypothetical protein